ncbi:MAG: radical SAM protein [bacterium]
MRVLLVQPDRKRSTSEDAPASGLLPARSLVELGGTLADHGHEVTVLDPLTAQSRNKQATHDMTAALADLLSEREFDAVGIAVYTPLQKEAHEMARLVKDRSPHTPVILGGPHTARMAGTLLDEWQEIDYVCLGGAEETLPVLLQNLAEGRESRHVSGTAYRKSNGLRQVGKPLLNLNVMDLPQVRYDRYLEELQEKKIERAYVMTARGCVNWCNFCSKIWKKFLPDRPDKIADEIEHLVKDCGTKQVIIYDDCFGKREDHALAMLEAIKRKGVEVELQAVTTFDSISRSWLKPFKEAGGRDILVGLESGAARLRKKMNKHFTEEDAISGVLAARTAGLRLGLYLMFGFYAQNEEDVAETYRLVDKMDPDQVMSSVYDVKPGDLLFEFAVTSGDLRVNQWKDENERLVSYMSDEEKERNAARAAYFDRRFTREVLVPEHERTADMLEINNDRLEQLIKLEKERLERDG